MSYRRRIERLWWKRKQEREKGQINIRIKKIKQQVEKKDRYKNYKLQFRQTHTLTDVYVCVCVKKRKNMNDRWKVKM